MSAGLTHFLTTAYAVMGMVALVAYVPQIKAFYHKPEVCAATPLVTWSLWGVQNVVFFFYAILANGDPMFILNTTLFMCATLTCLGLIVRGRALHKARVGQAGNVVVLKAA